MADVQYQRQRDLTHDTPLLQKQGLVDARYVAFCYGCLLLVLLLPVSSVPPSPSSLPEYVPMDFNSILQGALMPSQIKAAKANADLAL